MDLHKFGIKFYLKDYTNYSSKDYIPLFHEWIQNKKIPDHLLIDVADYSHVMDGPGIMLIAHEGYFSLDQENKKPSMLYMRKMNGKGSFEERFEFVYSMVLHMGKLLRHKKLEFKQNLFRFIANDRRLAANTNENQNLYKKEINGILKNKFPNASWDFSEITDGNERLAFTITFNSDVIILNE